LCKITNVMRNKKPNGLSIRDVHLAGLVKIAQI
jgi:hypothetical protein